MADQGDVTQPVGRTVLVTRPEPGASETASRIDAMGLRPLVVPTIRIRFGRANLPAPDRVSTVLVTSGQALQAIPDSYRRTPLFAVGDATASRARAAGFTDVVSAAGDATDLVAVVRNAVRHGDTVLLVTGRGLGHPLARSLRQSGYAVVRRSVYRHVPVGRLPAPAIRELRSGRLGSALFFSADTATCFAMMTHRAAIGECLRNIDAVAISQTVAVALKGLPWRRILVAARPNQDAMLKLLT